MARERFSDDDILKVLRQIEVDLASGTDIQTACRSAGVSSATYYSWRKRYGGVGRHQLTEMKQLEKENQQLKKIAAELTLSWTS